MSLLETYGKEIFSLLVPLVGWALNTFFKAKAKLLIANPHTFTFLVQQPLLNQEGAQVAPAQTLRTRSLMVWNVGRETGTRIEWVFNWKPAVINFWPSRHFDEHTEPDNRYTVIFDSLAPKETLGCEILSVNADLPNLVTIRSDQGAAQYVNMYPQPVIPIWKRRIETILVLAGVAVILYASIVVLQFLLLRTPFAF
jgi:hypothetical protein